MLPVHRTICAASLPSPPLQDPGLCIPAESIEGCTLLIQAHWNKETFPCAKSCTLKNDVGHEMGKLTFLLFDCISSNNIHSFSSFPSCIPLSPEFFTHKYVQVFIRTSYKTPVFCCQLQVGLRAAITTQTNRKILTHCVCAEISFNINEPMQWETTEMPLAMQW